MVEQSIHVALQQIVETNEKAFKEDKKKDAEKLAAKLESLEQERHDLNPTEAMNLRSQATTLDRVANYADNLANNLEQNKKEKLDKKKLEEIKEALMESLGIPAEFVDQLSILVKAGVQALREAAGVYRNKAEELRAQADLMTIEIEQIDTEINRLKNLKEMLLGQANETQGTMRDFVAGKLYRESIRDASEKILREALESISGEAGHEN